MKSFLKWNYRNGLMLASCAALILTNGLPVRASNSLPFAPGQNNEMLAIIVNKANPVENLSREELRKYFYLERERWPDGRKNTILMLPAGTAERGTVLQQIYQFNESDYTRYFLQSTYAGHGRSTPKELLNAVNMRKFVFNVPGALGYVRASELDDSVKVVRIDGYLPGDPNYPLKFAK